MRICILCWGRKGMVECMPSVWVRVQNGKLIIMGEFCPGCMTRRHYADFLRAHGIPVGEKYTWWRMDYYLPIYPGQIEQGV